MKAGKKPATLDSKVTMKVDSDVHAWLSLLAEKDQVTLSDVIRKLILECKPEVVRLQTEIEALKHKHLRENS